MNAPLQEIVPENNVIYSALELKALYSRGYYLYETGNFPQAIATFQELITIDPMHFAYWQGFSASLQMNREYHRAIYSWSVLIRLKPNYLLAYVHLASCLISIEATAHALQVLQTAKGLVWDPKNPDEVELRNQITLLENRWS